jgi:hypothetical protein
MENTDETQDGLILGSNPETGRYAMGKQNVKTNKLESWNQYKLDNVDDALGKIFEHAQATSASAREWYWQSIKSKKRASIGIRFVSFFLLCGGAALPIVAGILKDPEIRLAYTQSGVISLALAGLMQAADKVFGWSSGWTRYISTVTAMESATRKFGLDWANYIVKNNGALTDDDKRALFEIAMGFESEIVRLQGDETQKWIAEFNSGLALMNDLIKTQRETADKAMEEARVADSSRAERAATNAAAQRPGAIELSIVHKADPIRILIRVDDEPEESFTGTVWSAKPVDPGVHTVVAVWGDPACTVKKLIEVQPGSIARAELKL